MVTTQRTSPGVRFLMDAFFILLIFEGALRKWVLPELSDATLVIRDPIMLALYCIALSKGVFPVNGYVVLMIPLALLAFLMGLLGPCSNLLVQLYGLRVDFLYIPFIFIIPTLCNQEDLERWIRWTLYLTVFMTAIMVLQFASPPGSFINRQVGGAKYGLMGAEGKFRPAGTFSFITGISAFYPLSTALWFYYFVHYRTWGVIKFTIVAGAIIFAIPLSISRQMMLSVMIVIACGLFVMYQFNLLRRDFFKIVFVSLVVTYGLSFIPIFDSAIQVFTRRWMIATEQQGGVQVAIIDRYLDSFTNPIDTMFDAPIFGYGLGSGSNVGAKLLTGHRGFLIAEIEWSRIIGEMGPILGIAQILLRVLILLHLIHVSFKALFRGNALPLLICSANGLLILNGQWGPPTIQGFALWGAGITLLAAKPSLETFRKRI